MAERSIEPTILEARFYGGGDVAISDAERPGSIDAPREKSDPAIDAAVGSDHVGFQFTNDSPEADGIKELLGFAKAEGVELDG